jgi:hypothetical protein
MAVSSVGHATACVLSNQQCRAPWLEQQQQLVGGREADAVTIYSALPADHELGTCRMHD